MNGCLNIPQYDDIFPFPYQKTDLENIIYKNDDMNRKNIKILSYSVWNR